MDNSFDRSLPARSPASAQGNQPCGATSKSTVEQIRARFDADVERFANLHTGQSATVDSPLAMELVAETAAAVTPAARHVLDVGCGAGNYTLKLLERLPGLEVTLMDLSRPMLDRAEQRVAERTSAPIHRLQEDIREAPLEEARYDLVLAAAVLHHLRTDEEWHAVAAKLFRSLRPGGSLWIFDLVESDVPPIQAVLWRRYGEYLTAFRDEAYRDEVFAYIAQEDTPRSLMFQLDVLRQAGFSRLEVLHKHLCFAAFGGCKPA